MAGTVILRGPQAPADAPLGFCAVCIAVGKWLATAEIRAAVEKHERAGTGTRYWTLNVPQEYLQRAVGWGVIPGMGMAAPVCWSHAAGAQPSSGIIPVQAMPPGFGNGVPLLGQGG